VPVHEWLAPTKYVAAAWAIGFLLVTAGWVLWSSSRMRGLIDRMRTEDVSLWKELDSPETPQHLGQWHLRTKFRRLRTDPEYASRFNPLLMQELASLQRWIAGGLVFLAVAGCFVLYLVWPHR